ncbi:hypothetical protein QTP70_001209 [Hemibagrus guttatus]|uniref:ribonuclease H n=1 Tax=Hemibagrus guttatus TaxID=175788 RepID=A0AAE0V3L6_9TELE|nr:hypothetical protein QTP70_001209 [Hemibagrus guttatus]
MKRDEETLSVPADSERERQNEKRERETERDREREREGKREQETERAKGREQERERERERERDRERVRESEKERKGRELADMMERRKVDILCVQETRWKGSKARSIGAGFKLIYYGVDSKRNGVGVVLKEEFVRNVLEVGCELEEKERFWSELDEVMESIPTGERVVMGADFNGHVGEENTGDEEVMGKFGVKERNLEGQMVVDFAKRMDMGVVNTYFQKREEHRVTYKSGDLEKAYDRVSREELWYCMRKSGVAEKYVRVVQDMYERSRTVVRCAVGQTEEFKVEVGLHQGSALSPFLFAIVMDQLSEEVRQESPWTMMFAEDIVICSESREQVEENLERWRSVLERRGMKVSRNKTEYMCVNEREGSGTVRLQGEEVKKVQEFKYLGSTVQSNGECAKEVKKRVQAETVSLRKRQESELKMLRFSLGVMRLDRIRNEYIRGTAHVGRLGDKVREARLRWFGHVQRRERVAEKYVRVVQDMYERIRTVVRCAVGQTEEFNVEVGLHQGSALSPFLFAIVMDQLSEEVRQESPWTMMFAEDIVICSESREQVEENLERWRFALERRGMKVSRSKTEYMCVNEREGSGTVRLQGEEVKKVQEFKYLGSTVQSNGECGKEVKKRVQAGWNGWRKVSGVLCDRKISARIKGKVYRTVVRPAMLYGLETVSLRKRQESELEVAELKMLRFSLGVTRLDRIRNEYIRGTAHVGHLGDKVREARLRWFGHVQRRE